MDAKLRLQVVAFLAQAHELLLSTRSLPIALLYATPPTDPVEIGVLYFKDWSEPLLRELFQALANQLPQTTSHRRTRN